MKSAFLSMCYRWYKRLIVEPRVSSKMETLVEAATVILQSLATGSKPSPTDTPPTLSVDPGGTNAPPSTPKTKGTVLPLPYRPLITPKVAGTSKKFSKTSGTPPPETPSPPFPPPTIRLRRRMRAASKKFLMSFSTVRKPSIPKGSGKGWMPFGKMIKFILISTVLTLADGNTTTEYDENSSSTEPYYYYYDQDNSSTTPNLPLENETEITKSATILNLTETTEKVSSRITTDAGELHATTATAWTEQEPDNLTSLYIEARKRLLLEESIWRDSYVCKFFTWLNNLVSKLREVVAWAKFGGCSGGDADEGMVVTRAERYKRSVDDPIVNTPVTTVATEAPTTISTPTSSRRIRKRKRKERKKAAKVARKANKRAAKEERLKAREERKARNQARKQARKERQKTLKDERLKAAKQRQAERAARRAARREGLKEEHRKAKRCRRKKAHGCLPERRPCPHCVSTPLPEFPGEAFEADPIEIGVDPDTGEIVTDTVKPVPMGLLDVLEQVGLPLDQVCGAGPEITRSSDDIQDTSFVGFLATGNPDSFQVFCTGVYTRRGVFLTAAHCLKYQNFFIISGTPPYIIDDVIRLSVDSDYDSTTLVGDIGIVYTVGAHKYVFCGNISEPAVGASCNTYGFQHVDGALTNIFSATPLNLVEYTEDHVVAQGPDGIDVCNGDSGGPLICTMGDTVVLSGVVSHNYGCDNALIPSFFTRIDEDFRRIALTTAPPDDNTLQYYRDLMPNCPQKEQLLGFSRRMYKAFHGWYVPEDFKGSADGVNYVGTRLACLGPNKHIWTQDVLTAYPHVDDYYASNPVYDGVLYGLGAYMWNGGATSFEAIGDITNADPSEYSASCAMDIKWPSPASIEFASLPVDLVPFFDAEQNPEDHSDCIKGYYDPSLPTIIVGPYYGSSMPQDFWPAVYARPIYDTLTPPVDCTNTSVVSMKSLQRSHSGTAVLEMRFNLPQGCDRSVLAGHVPHLTADQTFHPGAITGNSAIGWLELKLGPIDITYEDIFVPYQKMASTNKTYSVEVPAPLPAVSAGKSKIVQGRVRPIRVGCLKPCDACPCTCEDEDGNIYPSDIVSCQTPLSGVPGEPTYIYEISPPVNITINHLSPTPLTINGTITTSAGDLEAGSYLIEGPQMINDEYVNPKIYEGCTFTTKNTKVLSCERVNVTDVAIYGGGITITILVLIICILVMWGSCCYKRRMQNSNLFKVLVSAKAEHKQQWWAGYQTSIVCCLCSGAFILVCFVVLCLMLAAPSLFIDTYSYDYFKTTASSSAALTVVPSGIVLLWLPTIFWPLWLGMIIPGSSAYEIYPSGFLSNGSTTSTEQAFFEMDSSEATCSDGVCTATISKLAKYQVYTGFAMVYTVQIEGAVEERIGFTVERVSPQYRSSFMYIAYAYDFKSVRLSSCAQESGDLVTLLTADWSHANIEPGCYFNLACGTTYDKCPKSFDAKINWSHACISDGCVYCNVGTIAAVRHYYPKSTFAVVQRHLLEGWEYDVCVHYRDQKVCETLDDKIAEYSFPIGDFTINLATSSVTAPYLPTEFKSALKMDKASSSSSRADYRTGDFPAWGQAPAGTFGDYVATTYPYRGNSCPDVLEHKIDQTCLRMDHDPDFPSGWNYDAPAGLPAILADCNKSGFDSIDDRNIFPLLNDTYDLVGSGTVTWKDDPSANGYIPELTNKFYATGMTEIEWVLSAEGFKLTPVAADFSKLTITILSVEGCAGCYVPVDVKIRCENMGSSPISAPVKVTIPEDALNVGMNPLCSPGISEHTVHVDVPYLASHLKLCISSGALTYACSESEMALYKVTDRFVAQIFEGEAQTYLPEKGGTLEFTPDIDLGLGLFDGLTDLIPAIIGIVVGLTLLVGLYMAIRYCQKSRVSYNDYKKSEEPYEARVKHMLQNERDNEKILDGLRKRGAKMDRV